MVSPSPTSSLFCLLLTATFFLVASGEAVENGEKMTHLHFYFFETDAGPNATLVVVADLHRNLSLFGNVVVYDNVLREGPDARSKVVGRAQGMGFFTSLDGTSALTAINFIFTSGEFNGSTLALLGVYELGVTSDRPIVGGSGRFRMARGYSLSKVVSSDAVGLVAEFDFYVYHY